MAAAGATAGGRGAAAASAVLALGFALLAGCAADPRTGGATASAEPAELLGLDPQRLAALLGDPELRRQEPPAEVWQYRNAACVLDIFFYPEGGPEGGPERRPDGDGRGAARQRVVHSEARSRTGTAGSVTARSCLNQLLAGRAQPRAAT